MQPIFRFCSEKRIPLCNASAIFQKSGAQPKTSLQNSILDSILLEINEICEASATFLSVFNLQRYLSCFQDSDSDWDSLSGGGPDIEPPSISNAQEASRQMKNTPAPPTAEKIPPTKEKGPPRAAEQYRNTANRGKSQPLGNLSLDGRDMPSNNIGEHPCIRGFLVNFHTHF